MTDPMANPGRRLYEQARRLRKAKRRMQLRSVTAVPTRPATVLQFPDKKEVTDGANLRPGEDRDLG
jgi:hypothetical protein